LCLHSKELKKKIAYKIKVDEYTIVTINKGFENLKPKEEKEGTENESETNSKRYRRRMVYEPNNVNGEKFSENNGLTTENSTIPTPDPVATSKPTNNNTATDAPTTEPEEEIIDNPDDKSKIIAQIGDKITKYPSVINFI
jgi:hypothetical protein